MLPGLFYIRSCCLSSYARNYCTQFTNAPGIWGEEELFLVLSPFRPLGRIVFRGFLCLPVGRRGLPRTCLCKPRSLEVSFEICLRSFVVGSACRAELVC